MNRCPITYEMCKKKYSDRGLKLLSPKLKVLHDFPYTPKEQIRMASEFAAKLSIQGIQPKLTLKLNSTAGVFEVVSKGGKYILKPPHQSFENVPENEDVTMRLAAAVDIETPFHGMIYNIDGSFSYFIERFDRLPKGKKVAVEDFSQLLGFSRDTKYEASMEKMILVIEKHCTFPKLEKIKFFRRVIFNFLVGNEDMHLKNYTLIRRDDKVELSPAYDLLNTTILLKAIEQIALPIRGKKSKLTRDDLVFYFGGERLGISGQILEQELKKFKLIKSLWMKIIDESFLSKDMRNSYNQLLKERFTLLFGQLGEGGKAAVGEEGANDCNN